MGNDRFTGIGIHIQEKADHHRWLFDAYFRDHSANCGCIFGDLVRWFSESCHEEAGAHFTSRDIIALMTGIFLSGAALSRTRNVTVRD